MDFLYLAKEDIEKLSEEEFNLLILKLERGTTLEIPKVDLDRLFVDYSH